MLRTIGTTRTLVIGFVFFRALPAFHDERWYANIERGRTQKLTCILYSKPIVHGIHISVLEDWLSPIYSEKRSRLQYPAPDMPMLPYANFYMNF